MKPITEEQNLELIEDLQDVIERETHSLYGMAARIALASLTTKAIGSFHIYQQSVEAISDYVKDGEWPIDDGELVVYTAPPVPVIKLPDEHGFDAWFKAVESGDDQDWSEPEYLSKEWHEYIGRRQLALGAYRFAINETKHLNGLEE